MKVKEAVEKSIELWTWLAETGSDDKRDWFKLKQITKSPLNDCYLCELFLQLFPLDHSCGKCPLVYRNSNCTDINHPYDGWAFRSKTPADRRKYAQQIVDILNKALESEE